MNQPGKDVFSIPLIRKHKFLNVILYFLEILKNLYISHIIINALPYFKLLIVKSVLVLQWFG